MWRRLTSRALMHRESKRLLSKYVPSGPRLVHDPYAPLFDEAEQGSSASRAAYVALKRVALGADFADASDDAVLEASDAPPVAGGTKQRRAGRVFRDRVRFTARGGRGGDGSNSMAISKVQKHTPPDGGPGGTGGSVVVVATNDMIDGLGHVPFVVSGKVGTPGAKNNQYGATGLDAVVRVPLGTVVRLRAPDDNDDDDFEMLKTVADLTRDGDRVVVAHGGVGGRGNSAVGVGARFRQARDAGRGSEGEECEVVLELKLIADAGLVGEPNAGKSTLLSAISRATPKVGAYKFTTLAPYIGTIQYDDYMQLRVADLPGLLEGSHEDRGVGADHLRHATRAAVLCIVVDVGSNGGVENALRQYRAMQHELAEWRERVAEDVEEMRSLAPPDATTENAVERGSEWHGGRHVVLVGTKLDLLDEHVDAMLRVTGADLLATNAMADAAREAARRLRVRHLEEAVADEPIDAVCGVSSLDGWGIDELTAQLRRSCEQSGRALR
jgi:GTP-binding protein